MNKTSEGYVTKEMAAERLGKSVRRIEEMVQEGKLSARPWSNPDKKGRTETVISAADLTRLLTERSPVSLEVARAKRELEAPESPQSGASFESWQWLTVPEAAQRSRLTVFVIRSLITRGELPAVWVGHHCGGGVWRINQAALDGYRGSTIKPE